MADLLEEIGKLQHDYEMLAKSGKNTAQNICDLVIPFKNKYGLTDSQALRAARNQIPLFQITGIIRQRQKATVPVDCEKCGNKSQEPGTINVKCLACRWQYIGQEAFDRKADLFVPEDPETEVTIPCSN